MQEKHITSPITQHDNQFEHGRSYDRSDGQKVNMTLVKRADKDAPASFILALFPREDNPNLEPSAQVEIFAEDMGILRDFVNGPAYGDACRPIDQLL